ncbi:ethanolamine kinase 1-like isoform X2 [Dreissena polymorpha]|uniref:ethanolamine kinase 1-like isoform X2 n=1 Tax=Dreissena polymorpha TaxID=45954 RepID=UPI002264EFBA|nr:ethanolamine kinase 1-like isoform X2 [Dreissena polymorpha]
MIPDVVNVEITIDPLEIKRNSFNDSVLEVIKAVRPAWFAGGDVQDQVKCKEFTGGISNILFGYYQSWDDVVLMRVYGEGSGLMIDRDQEKINIQILHAAGRCAPLYGTFNNGVLYGFVQGVTLEVDTVRDEQIGKLIAQEMIELHKVKVPNQEVRSGLWKKMSRFLDLGPDEFADPETNKRYKETVKSKGELREELAMLQSHLEVLDSPVVFCHNDLLLKNILYDQDKGVDDVDFSRYPDRAHQLRWLRNYLELKAVDAGQPDTVTDQDVERCYVITNKFALAGHLFWGLWGLVQAKNSLIDFGFLEYAQMKLGEYFNRKEEFLALKLPE